MEATAVAGSRRHARTNACESGGRGSPAARARRGLNSVRSRSRFGASSSSAFVFVFVVVVVVGVFGTASASARPYPVGRERRVFVFVCVCALLAWHELAQRRGRRRRHIHGRRNKTQDARRKTQDTDTDVQRNVTHKRGRKPRRASKTAGSQRSPDRDAAGEVLLEVVPVRQLATRHLAFTHSEGLKKAEEGLKERKKARTRPPYEDGCLISATGQPKDRTRTQARNRTRNRNWIRQRHRHRNKNRHERR